MEGTYGEQGLELTDQFFRHEYGKLVAVTTGYLGTDYIEAAEDIAQESLLRAVSNWEHSGIPKNPQAWLYTTAKNLSFNVLKREKYKSRVTAHFQTIEQASDSFADELEISEEIISDEQLKMMFVCCHPSNSKNTQITLILKVLCGFSITETANAFLVSKETVNKRLVRGRKRLREAKVNFEIPENVNERLPVVLEAIFLLFNEGYYPTEKNRLINYDLCLESIRLAEILVSCEAIEERSDCFALLALMYFNASRFDSRMNSSNSVVELDKQDRTTWNQDLINQGIQNLDRSTKNHDVSTYTILATISANHCVAKSFEQTNWKEILSLYDCLIKIKDTPIVRLNRSVATAKVHGNKKAISELESLEKRSDIDSFYLFHSTLAELYKEENETEKAGIRYKRAISLTQNIRDIELLQKKLMESVPI